MPRQADDPHVVAEVFAAELGADSGVLRQFQPQLDIILIVSDDERLKHSGIAAGMSGSPIYLEGKLAGALAYGWSFAKDPIAGAVQNQGVLMAESNDGLLGLFASANVADDPAEKDTIVGGP